MLVRVVRVWIAAALLLAQQAALGHQIWHLAAAAGRAAAGSAAGSNPAAPAPQERLCDLHASLGAVLGALGCAAPHVTLAAASEVPFGAVELPGAGTPGPRPASRGPPPLR